MTDPNDEVEDWDALQAAITEHAEIIGRVTVRWNMCQLLVFALFYNLSGMSWEKARAVFFALKADVQQRDITMALALELPSGKGSPRKKVTTAIGGLNNLANERNSAIHTIWQVSPEEGRIVPASDIKHNPALQIDDPLEQFESLEEKLSNVHNALLKAAIALAVYAASPDTILGQNLDPGANG